MAIDVGSAAIDRNGVANGTVLTLIELGNPANASGIIDTVEIWMQTGTTGAKIGSFYNTGGNNYKCRDSVSIGAISAGSKQTFTSLSLSIQSGDFLGVKFNGGEPELSGEGGSGVAYVSGDYCDVDDEVTYGVFADNALSLYGSGTEAASSSSSSLSSSHSSSSHSSSSHSSSSSSRSSSHSSSSHSSSSSSRSSSHSSSSHSSSSHSSSSHSSSSHSSSHSSSSHSSSHSSSSHSSLSSSHSSSSHSSSSRSSSHSSSSRSSSHSSSSHSSSSHSSAPSSSHSSSSHSSSSRSSSHSSSSHSSSSHSSSHSSSSQSSSTSPLEPETVPDFPADRPVSYDPDLVFDDVTGTWVDSEELLAGNGSRYRGQLVAIGRSLIYYEEIT